MFSDDKEWCKQVFENDDIQFCEDLNWQEDYLQLYLMSRCSHQIIANSSYSWWGAWLNTKENKRVIAPSSWFGPAINKDASEIYCEGWEKI
jgi:hypothetical protein